MNRARHLILPLAMLIQASSHLFWLTSAAQVGLITIPWLLNRGGVLYGTVLEHRAPLLAYTIALSQQLIPLDPATLLRLINIGLVLGGSVLVYTITLRLTGRWLAAVIALGVWAWWEPVYGNILFYYDSVLGMLLLGGFGLWLTLKGHHQWWTAPFGIGLLLGIGVMVKQHGGAALVIGGLWLLTWGGARRGRLRSAVIYCLGGVLVPLLIVVYQAAIGNLSEFIYWTVTFNLSGDVPPLPPTSAFVYKMLLTHLFLPAFVLFTLRKPQPERFLLLGLWAAGAVTLFPKAGEIHTMALLPVLSVMSGWAAADLLPTTRLRPIHWLREATPTALGLVSVVGLALVGWLWAGLITLIPTEVGRGAMLAYDEFEPLAAQLNNLTEDGDTLFVLPALDGNPQLHLMTGLMPPGTWTTTHDCMLCAPGLAERLLSEWGESPPTWIVYFPDLVNPRQNIEPLLDFLQAEYVEVDRFDSISFNGPGTVYLHKDSI
jgi:hypothetical protein